MQSSFRENKLLSVSTCVKDLREASWDRKGRNFEAACCGVKQFRLSVFVKQMQVFQCCFNQKDTLRKKCDYNESGKLLIGTKICEQLVFT